MTATQKIDMATPVAWLMVLRNCQSLLLTEEKKILVLQL